MTIHFEVPSMEMRNQLRALEQSNEFNRDLRTWLNVLTQGLPMQKGETVWFRVFRDVVSYKCETQLIAEAARIYREKGYFVRPLYSSYQCDWDEVHEYIVFEMSELDLANPKHYEQGHFPTLLERIACRIQYRLGIKHRGRRYSPY